MTQIQIGLGAVIGHEHLAVLQRQKLTDYTYYSNILADTLLI